MGWKKKLRKITLFFETMADYGVCVYIFLILAVLPFYFTAGYSRIGTDKAMFFRSVNRNMGKILLPLAAIILILKTANAVLHFIKNRKGEDILRKTGKKKWLRAKVHAFCRKFYVTDCFVFVYAVSLILSYLLSDYKETAWFGTRGWYMGFFTQMAFVLIYFFVSRLWRPRKWMLYLVLSISSAVFLLGYLDRFGLHIMEMENRTGGFISTIGNINWYCGYAVSVFFLGVVLFWKEVPPKSWRKLLLMAYIALGFATLMTQGSESGILTTGVMLLVLFCMSVDSAEKMLLFWQEMMLLTGACLMSCFLRVAVGERFAYIEGSAVKLVTGGVFSGFVTMVSVFMLLWVWRSQKRGKYREQDFKILARALVICGVGIVLLALILAAVNTAHPGSIGPLSEYSVFTFSYKWGSSRGATWQAARMCFGEQTLLHKLVGVGPDAMSAYMYGDGSEALRSMLRECFGTATLANAHNEWLTVLADVGILGLIGYVGLMLSAMVQFFKKGKQDALLCGCGFCLLAYTVNNMFSFQQTMNGATIFVILGIGAAFLNRQEGNPTE